MFYTINVSTGQFIDFREAPGGAAGGMNFTNTAPIAEASMRSARCRALVFQGALQVLRSVLLALWKLTWRRPAERTDPLPTISTPIVLIPGLMACVSARDENRTRRAPARGIVNAQRWAKGL